MSHAFRFQAHATGALALLIIGSGDRNDVPPAMLLRARTQAPCCPPHEQCCHQRLAEGENARPTCLRPARRASRASTWLTSDLTARGSRTRRYPRRDHVPSARPWRGETPLANCYYVEPMRCWMRRNTRAATASPPTFSERAVHPPPTATPLPERRSASRRSASARSSPRNKAHTDPTNTRLPDGSPTREDDALAACSAHGHRSACSWTQTWLRRLRESPHGAGAMPR